MTVLDSVPEVPVTVTFTVPASAVLLAVSVKVLLLVVLLGLNEAATPLGSPDALKLTLLLKPFCGATVMVLVPLVPGARLKLAGEAVSVKVGEGVTVSVRDVVRVKPPDVPLMVTFAVPAGAVLLAANVKVLAPVVLLGSKEAVTPLGRPEVLKLTLPVKPFCGVIVMVLVLLVPGAMLKVFGDAERAKFGSVGLVMETLSKVAVACEVEPLFTARPR